MCFYSPLVAKGYEKLHQKDQIDTTELTSVTPGLLPKTDVEEPGRYRNAVGRVECNSGLDPTLPRYGTDFSNLKVILDIERRRVVSKYLLSAPEGGGVRRGELD